MSFSYQRAFRAGTMDVWGYLEESRRLDVDGVDLHTRLLAADDPGHLREIKRRCLALGLPIACLNVSNNFARPAADIPGQIELGKRGIDVAAILGAPQVRLFAGVPAPDESRPAAWARCVDALKECAEYGRRQGILACLQNHNDGALTEYGKDVLALVQQAGPHLGHVWDTGQYVGSPGASGARDGSAPALGSAPTAPAAPGAPAAREVLYESLQQTVHLATHVRCKIYAIASGEEAWLDYPRIFHLLGQAGYNGFCSIVYEGRGDDREDVGRAVPFLRRVMATARRS